MFRSYTIYVQIIYYLCSDQNLCANIDNPISVISSYVCVCVCVFVCVMLRLAIMQDMLMVGYTVSEDLSSTIDKVNNLGHNQELFNSSSHIRGVPQMDGKLVESTSTKSSKNLSNPLEIAPIKINGKPLEKVNVKYTHNIYFSVKSSWRNYKGRVFTSMLTWFQVLDKDEV